MYRSKLQDYINLEKSIYRYERKNVIKKYESKSIFADDIKKTVDQLEATYKELRKQTYVFFTYKDSGCLLWLRRCIVIIVG